MNDHLDPETREHVEWLIRGLLVTRGDSHESQPRLFLGTIPDGITVDLPLPEQTQVLGSLVYSDTDFEMLLESAVPRVELLSFYRTRLAALDWLEPPAPPRYHLGGLVPADFDPTPPDTSLHVVTFFHDASGAYLIVTLQPLDTGPTFIRLELSLDADQNRRAFRQMRDTDPKRMRQRIPFLSPPPGARQEPRAGLNSSRDSHSIAALTTPLGLEAVAGHYAELLRHGGWTETEHGASGPLAWQRWQFTNEDQEPWTGLFFALHTPGESCDYFLYVRATGNPPPHRP
ncbi:MAG: hypothetical protein ACLQUY_15015 [Ktedonobacterales bacterium]